MGMVYHFTVRDGNPVHQESGVLFRPKRIYVKSKEVNYISPEHHRNSLKRRVRSKASNLIVLVRYRILRCRPRKHLTTDQTGDGLGKHTWTYPGRS